MLRLTIDGAVQTFDAEQKPTLVRHGLTYLSGHRATLPDGTTVEASAHPDLFRFVTAFGLRCYNGTFQIGVADDVISRDDAIALGKRLELFAMAGSPPWADIVNSLVIHAPG